LLEDWGFIKWGTKKSTGEIVMIRNFAKSFNIANPKLSYPFISLNEGNKIFIVPILPDYHTELFPDSILRTESPDDFKEDKPHRNAISKVYISRSIERNVSGEKFNKSMRFFAGCRMTNKVIVNMLSLSLSS